MTTIVYDHKNQLIACDSRMSKARGVYNDCADKFIISGDSLFVLCGSMSDLHYFADSYQRFKRNGLDEMDLECSGIMIKDKKAYHVFEAGQIFNEEKLVCNEAFGSGADFALSAMDFGKSAKDAVEYAKTRDIYTGGAVRVYDIEKCEFIE